MSYFVSFMGWDIEEDIMAESDFSLCWGLLQWVLYVLHVLMCLVKEGNTGFLGYFSICLVNGGVFSFILVGG